MNRLLLLAIFLLAFASPIHPNHGGCSAARAADDPSQPKSVFETNAAMKLKVTVPNPTRTDAKATAERTIDVPKGTKVWAGPYLIFEMDDGKLWFVPPEKHWDGLTVDGHAIPEINIKVPQDQKLASEIERVKADDERYTASSPIKVGTDKTTEAIVGAKAADKMTVDGVAIHKDLKSEYYIEDVTGERCLLMQVGNDYMIGRTDKALKLNPSKNDPPPAKPLPPDKAIAPPKQHPQSGM